MLKEILALGSEFQSRTYDAMVSHTAIVFTRYTILEWIRQNQNDQKTYGELSLFVEHISALSADITSCIKSKVTEWMLSQSSFIQALFGNICWES